MNKNPFLALVLSLVPGLGQIYTGKIKKGLTLLCVGAGIVLTLILSRSPLAHLLVTVTYFALMIPSAIEAYLFAKRGESSLDLDHPVYIIAMLLLTGFSAVPLLWQSGHFSRNAKIAWTVAVAVLAVLFFGGLAVYWKDLDGWLKTAHLG